MIHLSRLVPLVAVVVSLPAAAAPTQEATAEHTRLAEEMRRLASRNAWRGVESGYVKMMALEKKGLVLSYDDHMLGAQAARDLGRITDVYDRLARAREQQASEEVVNWMAEISASYGRVDLSIAGKYDGNRDLAPDMMPFAPDQRAAIGAAQAGLAESGRYNGLLPYGGYTFGEEKFIIVQDGDTVEVALAPEVPIGRQPTGRRDGFRIDLGGLYTAVGTSSAGGVQAEAFSGFGLRAGLGWEVQLSDSIGLLAQAGYHGMLGGSAEGGGAPAADWDVSSQPVADSQKDALTMFYAWGGLTWFKGDLAISAGPSWAGGTASTMGVSTGCVSGSGKTCDEDGAFYGGTGSSDVAVTGKVLTGGATLGMFYGLFDFPGMRNGRGGIGLYAGAQSDLARLYPWAQVAFTIAPTS